MSTKWFSGDVVANGVKLHYYRTGGDKPPVVLAHGITDNGLCWTRLAQALEKEYDLIMIDARGHGLSDAPARDYSRKDHAADLAGLVEALGLGKPVLIGHSMGASNVTVAAVTYPDLARGAILEDPPWRKDQVAAELAARAAEWRIEIIDRKSQPLAEIIAAGRAENPTWAEAEWQPWAESKLQVNPDVLQWIDEEMMFAYWQNLIPRITCPMLLVTADPALEAIVTPEVAQMMVDLNPQIQVAHISGAGHNIRREQFERYVEVVSTFLREVY
jgi:pimeloyl-ACP methyl ester carboxylesterase